MTVTVRKKPIIGVLQIVGVVVLMALALSIRERLMNPRRQHHRKIFHLTQVNRYSWFPL
jgi:hypothetical protein